MTHRPKLSICIGKPQFADKQGKIFYRANYLTTISLDPNNCFNKANPNKTYAYLDVKTEKELLWWIYQNFGNPKENIRISIIGHLLGHKAYCFWRGEIGPDGWLFLPQTINQKGLEWIQEEIRNSEDDEDTEIFEEILSDEKKALRKARDKKRYGFEPFLKSSGKRGQEHHWDEEEPEEEKQNIIPKNKQRGFDEMSIDELNNF